ncbi:hypothetical protein VNO78_17812 [Psophocarpus tetragonolobus]|uniref:BACK domain-containing protein n=1 Tax=Psophocarpus tetragonolobus TaxID=3891 RepID=A0AAN9XLL0_PSOTE
MEVSDEDDEHVILLCNNTDPIETLNHEILVSTTDILAWDLPTILTFPTIQVQTHRNKFVTSFLTPYFFLQFSFTLFCLNCLLTSNLFVLCATNRLIEQSLYFRGLLGGSFSESCFRSVTINWNVSEFLQILKHMCGCVLDITLDNFFPLYEGALYFGVETLILKCETWLSEVLSSKGFQSTQIQMEDLIQIWKFGSDRASDFILHLCIGYLARNFMWAKQTKLFGKLPYDLLLSSLKHPHLTVDSELHLSDALLLWLESNMGNSEKLSKAEDNCNGILKQIRVGLLPLWFALGIPFS